MSSSLQLAKQINADWADNEASMVGRAKISQWGMAKDVWSHKGMSKKGQGSGLCQRRPLKEVLGK